MIKRLIDKNIIERGEFTLKSGEKSDIYIDLRKVISYPELHRDICEEIYSNIDLNVDLICGTPYGAIPYASYISIKNNIPMIFLRKEVKQHGTKKLVEGVYQPNQRVVLIEDVVTSGNSVREAAEILESQGLKVSQIITIVSRSKEPLFYNDIPIKVDLPNQINCKIETTDVALKGQTVSSSYKPAILENGIKIQVPPFIESGDSVVVDTRSIEYIKKI